MYDNNQNTINHEIKKIGITMAAQNNTTANNANNANNNNNNSNAINQNLKQNQLHQMQNGTGNGNNMMQQQQQQQQQQQLAQHQYSQSDLEELTSQEISLDLAHLIDDQFRDQESLALFSEMVPAVVNGGLNNQTATAAKLLQLQQARLSQRQNNSYSQLAYMPQPVHTGECFN
jgi:CCAAT/enhancer binding protein (C/EBP)